MSTKYAVVSLPLSQSPVQLAAKLNELFTVAGAIDLQWIRHRARSNTSSINVECEVVYNDPGGLNYAAVAFAGNSTASAQAQINAYLAANPTFQVKEVLDISSTYRRSTLTDAALVIVAEQLESRCDQATRYWPACPIVDIAPGASGVVQITTAAGLNPTPVVTTTNRGQFTWQAGVKGQILKLPGACDWVGYPSCCTLFDPADLPALIAWYDADDAATITTVAGDVSGWDDKSGNGINMIQPTAARRPMSGAVTIGGRNTITFTAADNTILYRMGGSILDNDFTVISVAIGPTNNNGILFGEEGGFPTLAATYRRLGNHGISMRNDGGAINVDVNNGLALSTVNPTIISSRYLDPNWISRINGTQIATRVISANPRTPTSQSIGALRPGSPFFQADMDLAEIVVLPAASDADIEKVEGYLAWKWGLVSNLPAGHPYKSGPPLV